MKRIIGDVPRWHILLHRESRGIESVDLSDGPRRRLEDELFERLYAGELEPIEGDNAGGGPLSSWARALHETCTQLPAFQRLSEECVGDELAAGLGVETIMAELGNRLDQAEPVPDGDLRRLVRTASEKCSAQVEDLRECLQGLEHVSFAARPGAGRSQNSGDVATIPHALARRLKTDQRLKKIAKLAGRFKRVAAQKRRSRVRHGHDEISTITQGADIARLLPSELARLRHPRLRTAFLRDILERRALTYGLEGTDTLGKGPILVALDKSGSMDGPRDTWATATTLALLEMAAAERRTFALLAFDGAVKFEAVVRPGDLLPEQALCIPADGGTSIATALSRGLAIIHDHGAGLRRADLILVTDGASDDTLAQELRRKANELHVEIIGIGIGVAEAALLPWCHQVHVISDLDRLDDRTSDLLFAG